MVLETHDLLFNEIQQKKMCGKESTLTIFFVCIWYSMCGHSNLATAAARSSSWSENLEMADAAATAFSINSIFPKSHKLSDRTLDMHWDSEQGRGMRAGRVGVASVVND